ncbi:MAG: hypothetical protein NVSMB16_04640 [Acidimicrobiales bacterium]
MIVDLEVHALPVAKELVAAPVQPHCVVLKTVPETRLDDPPTPLDIVDQKVEAIAEIIVEARRKRAHEAGEQQSPRTRRRLGREVQLAQCDPSCRGDRSGMADLKLGQEHRQSVEDGLLVPAKGRSERRPRWRTTGLATY